MLNSFSHSEVDKFSRALVNMDFNTNFEPVDNLWITPVSRTGFLGFARSTKKGAVFAARDAAFIKGCKNRKKRQFYG
jgi:hypothetical protein